jgi:hypothetical protein
MTRSFGSNSLCRQQSAQLGILSVCKPKVNRSKLHQRFERESLLYGPEIFFQAILDYLFS